MHSPTTRTAVEEAIAATSFCTLATTSAANRPHVATYGIGVPVEQLEADPLSAFGSVAW